MKTDSRRSAVEDLGFDACIDHRDPALMDLLAKACPKGIDVYFESVGGIVFDRERTLENWWTRLAQ